MRLLFFRFHEWLANHISGVQYPRQTFIPKQPKQPFFKYDMPWPMRMLLLGVSIIMITIGLLGLGFIALLIYSVLAVAFNW